MRRLAVEYATNRVVFDRPIGSNQAIAFPLAIALGTSAGDGMTAEAATIYATNTAGAIVGALADAGLLAPPAEPAT